MDRKRDAITGQFVEQYDKQDLLNLIHDDNVYTVRELEMQIKWGKKTVKRYLNELVISGHLKRKKTEHSWVYWKKKSS